MAKYRQLYTEFWSDSFVLELTPEEKYFYLYLMTNTKTTQSGIYEISKRTIETDTGYNRETVEKLISRFCEYKKILYCDDTKELMVINWIKYNVPNNVNSIKCVQREICRVKNSEFVKILFNKCQAAGLDVDKIFQNTENVIPETIIDDVQVEEIQKISEYKFNKPLSRGLQGPCKDLVSNRIRSNKEEVISNKQKILNKEEEVRNKNEVAINNSNSTASAIEIENIIKTFEENIHAITPLEYDKIFEFASYVTSEVIIMAIEEAVLYNAKSIKYIAEILNSWISHGIKTVDEVKVYQKKWANKKTNNINQNVKKGGFCSFEQRTYDYEALEKKLLGYADSEETDDLE